MAVFSTQSRNVYPLGWNCVIRALSGCVWREKRESWCRHLKKVRDITLACGIMQKCCAGRAARATERAQHLSCSCWSPGSLQFKTNKLCRCAFHISRAHLNIYHSLAQVVRLRLIYYFMPRIEGEPVITAAASQCRSESDSAPLAPPVQALLWLRAATRFTQRLWGLAIFLHLQ